MPANMATSFSSRRPHVNSSERRRTILELLCVDGTDLIGADDANLLADGLHPTDAGYRVLAERIAPRLRAVEAAAR